MKRILILLFLLTFSSLIFAQEAVRTWTSKVGKTIEATWDSEKDSEPETVFLLKNGKRYRFPLNNLSEEDQKYVTDGRAKKAPPVSEEEDSGREEVVDPIPGEVMLPPEFNPDPRQYEKFWEQKGITGKIALSRDGKYLAVTCSNDIKTLDFYTGEVLQTLKGHTGNVKSVSYSPDGRFLASVSHDNTIRIWNAQTGECVKTLNGHESACQIRELFPRREVSLRWRRFCSDRLTGGGMIRVLLPFRVVNKPPNFSFCLYILNIINTEERIWRFVYYPEEEFHQKKCNLLFKRHLTIKKISARIQKSLYIKT